MSLDYRRIALKVARARSSSGAGPTLGCYSVAMSNRLANETSPYLLQHAENPVDWHPWDRISLDLAKHNNKPILLSIGYSACHWCHVMAHESFEDARTAELMNRLYVNIKVDREERPDLDRIYQSAHQLFTRRPGGWPLTVFLTPDEHLPIYAGTYFPKDPNYGMPAFSQVLERVESYFQTHADEIRAQGQNLVDALQQFAGDETLPSTALSREPIIEARRRFAASFDARYGGFGDAPKFPHSTNLDVLLEIAWHADDSRMPDDDARLMATHSLTQMANSGLYDQLAGGFFRYSVDAQWAIPHFEKMLYDNAALLTTYCDAYAATGERLYAEVARGTADWAIREMQDSAGAFYAALDADSEGQEGKFYVWTPYQFRELLDADECRIAEPHFGLDQAPNFEGDSWHLHVAQSLDVIAAQQGIDVRAAADSLASAREKLLRARVHRVWPGRDEKILVAWNGMMIAALAKAARTLHRPDYAEAATRAIDFIREHLWADGRLKASYKDGRARFQAYLDDYAFLASALLELLQCRWRSMDLLFARELADVMLTYFADVRGGFFFTANDHEPLIHKPKPLADEAIPAGNAVAALLLTDLGHLLGEHRYLDAAKQTVQTAFPSVSRHPDAHATLLRGIQRQLEPPELIVVRGSVDELSDWRSAVANTYRPNRLSFFIPVQDSRLPGLLGERVARDSAVAYVCQGTKCSAPVATRHEFVTTLSD